MGWELPTSHNEPGDAWINPAQAYDNNVTTNAYKGVASASWGDWLEFYPNEPTACSRIRFYATYSVVRISSIDIDAYYSGAWQHVYQGAFADGQYVEKSLADLQTVTAFRVRFYNSYGSIWPGYLFEFHFNQPKPYTDLSLAVSGEWQLNDDKASSDVVDTSGNGNDGTLKQNGSPYNTDNVSEASFAANLDKCFNLTAANEEGLFIPHSSILKPTAPFSVSLWFETGASVATSQALYESEPHDVYYRGFWIQFLNGGILNVVYGDGGSQQSYNRRTRNSSIALSANTKYHIVCNFNPDGSNFPDIYINNILRNGESSGTGSAILHSTGETLIGLRQGANKKPFDGKMDQVRLFDRQLTAAERTFLYNGGDGIESLGGIPTEYRFVLRKRNKYNLVSQNTEQFRIRLDDDGNEIEPAPTAPSNIQIEPAPAGLALVTAQYFYDTDDSYQADQWLIYYTSDGADPDPETDAPFVVDMKKLNGIAALNWTSPFGGDGLTLKALVRSRRSGTPYNYDSENTEIVSCIGSTAGPAVIDEAHTTQGQAMELIK